jgi:hypothetical protein
MGLVGFGISSRGAGRYHYPVDSAIAACQFNCPVFNGLGFDSDFDILQSSYGENREILRIVIVHVTVPVTRGELEGFQCFHYPIILSITRPTRSHWQDSGYTRSLYFKNERVTALYY